MAYLLWLVQDKAYYINCTTAAIEKLVLYLCATLGIYTVDDHNDLRHWGYWFYV